MTRLTCKHLISEKVEWLPGSNYCGNHPHNYYIQLFAETGFVGLLSGFVMFLGIMFTSYSSRKTNKCPMAYLYFVIPLIIFSVTTNWKIFLVNGEIYLYGFALAFILPKTKII